MAGLSQEVILNIQQALRQIDDLERELGKLAVDIPVHIDSTGANRLEQDLSRADNSADSLNRELRTTGTTLDTVEKEAREAGREMDDAAKKGESSFRKLGLAIGGLAVGAGIVAGLRKFTQFAGEAIAAASNLGESVNAVNVVFEDSAEGILELGRNAARSVGLSNAEFNTFAVSLSAFAQQIAGDTGDVVGTMDALTVRIADFASVMNLEVSAAAEKFQSGLAGQSRPLREFGIDMSAAAVNAFALANGIGEAGREMTEAEKVQARYGLLMEQTAKVQGDFANTSDQLANRQRIATAEFENFRAEIGVELIPVLEALMASIPGVLEAIRSFIPVLTAVAESVGPLLLQFSALFGLIDKNQANLTIWAQQSGKAADSADLLAGAIFQTNKELERHNQTQSRGSSGFRDFRTELQELLRVAQTSPEELRRLFRDIGNLSDFFDADEIAIIREELRKLLVETGQFSTFSEGARFLDQFGSAAGEVAGTLPRLTSGVSDTTRRLAALAREAANFSFQALPDALSAAKDALRDEQNEIVTSFAEFADNLFEALASRRQFQTNLNVLRALGLEGLADAFEAAGLDSAAALTDALANPGEAARREAELRAQGALAGAEYAREFQAIAASILADGIEVPGNINFELGRITGLGQQFFDLNVNIPGGGAAAGPVTNVTNIFNTEPQPTTDTQRISQAVANVQ